MQTDLSLAEAARARDAAQRDREQEEHARRVAAAVEAADRVHGAITESVVQSGGGAGVGVGLTLREASGGVIKVSDIRAGSPASSSRISVGDIVVEVGGHKIKADSKVAHVEKLLVGEVGQHVELRLRAAGAANGAPKGKDAAAEYTLTLVCKKASGGQKAQGEALDLVLARTSESCDLVKSLHALVLASTESLASAAAQHTQAEADWLAQFDSLVTCSFLSLSLSLSFRPPTPQPAPAPLPSPSCSLYLTGTRRAYPSLGDGRRAG